MADRLENHCDMLCKFVSAAQDQLDRIAGPVQRGLVEGGNAPHPAPSAISRLEHQLDRLAAILGNDLHALYSRLSEL